MKRPYQLKQRRERQEQTRQNIIEAAIDLHQAKGLAATTVRDIADRADVGRVTVYRHFPDEAALVSACSGQYFQRYPLPNPEPWLSVEDFNSRLRLGLLETYAYHRKTEAMMTRIHAEAEDHPAMAPYHAHWQRAANVLADGWSEPGKGEILLRAALAHALRFDTWRSLVRLQKLTDKQAIELMVRLICSCPDNSDGFGPV